MRVWCNEVFYSSGSSKQQHHINQAIHDLRQTFHPDLSHKLDRLEALLIRATRLNEACANTLLSNRKKTELLSEREQNLQALIACVSAADTSTVQPMIERLAEDFNKRFVIYFGNHV